MSKRTDQVSSLLVVELNNILLREFEAPKDCMVSVSRATISPDLKNATAYLSILPHDKVGSCSEAVRKAGNHIQHHLAKKLSMRVTPKIKWEVDDTDIKYEAIDEALNQ